MDLGGLLVVEGVRPAFAGDYRDGLFAPPYRDREHVPHAVSLAVVLVDPGGERGAAVRGRVGYAGVLFVGLFHGAFQVAHHLHLALEMVGVAYGREHHVVVLDHADAHPFGVVAVGDFARKCECRRLESLRLADNPHDVQDLVHLPDLGTGGAQRVLQRLDDGALVELRLFLVLCGHWLSVRVWFGWK